MNYVRHELPQWKTNKNAMNCLGYKPQNSDHCIRFYHVTSGALRNKPDSLNTARTQLTHNTDESHLHHRSGRRNGLDVNDETGRHCPWILSHKIHTADAHGDFGHQCHLSACAGPTDVDCRNAFRKWKSVEIPAAIYKYMYTLSVSSFFSKILQPISSMENKTSKALYSYYI